MPEPEAIPDAPATAVSQDVSAQVHALHVAARAIAIAMSVTVVAAFVFGYEFLREPHGLKYLPDVALVGFAGASAR